ITNENPTRLAGQKMSCGAFFFVQSKKKRSVRAKAVGAKAVRAKAVRAKAVGAKAVRAKAVRAKMPGQSYWCKSEAL
ncbi:MAG: hypothetical protein GX146_06850, partial [Myxococcales bacterium]|nr:hypothetical protein [Myxococcales bacterium]